MKFILIFTTLLIHTTSLYGQDVANKNQLAALKKQFDALPIDKRETFVSLKSKALKALDSGKVFSALCITHDANAIFDGDPGITLLQGIISAQLHKDKEAINLYKKVLTIVPSHPQTLQSLADIHFSRGDYAEAIFYIEKLNKLFISRFNKREPLLDFKLLISLEKLPNKTAAQSAQLKKMYSMYDFNDDHPFYYFSEGLKLIVDGKKEEGTMSIAKAFLIFREVDKVNFWRKALVDANYIEEYELMFELRSQEEVDDFE